MFAEVDFRPHCEIPLDRVKEALQEFTTTGRRPGCVEWREDPYSSTISG
ncbi:Imm1 family immunity protein [Lentzea sp. NPDC004782]